MVNKVIPAVISIVVFWSQIENEVDAACRQVDILGHDVRFDFLDIRVEGGIDMCIVYIGIRENILW